MAWLRLTLQDGRTDLINTDQVSEVYDCVSDKCAELRLHDGITIVRESVDEIAAMIEKSELRERVLKCACAIMANEHSNGLAAEQLWLKATRFAAMEAYKS